MKSFYKDLKKQKGFMLSYIAAALAVNTTPPPEMRLMRDELQKYTLEPKETTTEITEEPEKDAKTINI